MSIVGAMYSGISGLNTNAMMMEIIGNNLANINTPAFKFSRADFGDILSRPWPAGWKSGAACAPAAPAWCCRKAASRRRKT
jgi:flagellar basal body rod protein FlgG